MTIGVIEIALLTVSYCTICAIIAVIQNAYYKKHPYRSKEKTLYQKWVESWEKVYHHDDKPEEKKEED